MPRHRPYPIVLSPEESQVLTARPTRRKRFHDERLAGREDRPRDPAFEVKAGRILDLYARTWDGAPLTDNEFVLSADKKTRIQARRRIHPTAPARAGHVMHVEHEYARAGPWAYLAAWDVHRAKVFGRGEPRTGIAPSREATRVFWIVDNGSSHRAARAVARLQQQYPNLVRVHGPVHASWLNQIEIYFSIVQRKVLKPSDFASLAAVEDRRLAFQRHYESPARPFQWTFTGHDLAQLLATLARAPLPALAA